MKYFISITVILFLLICTWSCALKVHEKHLYKTEVEAVHSGTIVDKKIVNPENGLFKSHGTEYYIIIDTGIDKPTLLPDGEKLTKSFSVSEDVYLKYNVGDIFDSYNYKSSSETATNATTIINGKTYELVPKS